MTELCRFTWLQYSFSIPTLMISLHGDYKTAAMLIRFYQPV